jgi:hypothetical protein
MLRFIIEINLYDLEAGGNLFHRWILRHTLLMYSRLAPDGHSRFYYTKCTVEALHHLMFLFEECEPFFDMTVRRIRE